jgi:HPt (histidine-containing phosphotransfer) domain-containing protein
MDGYISKPVRMEKIREALEKYSRIPEHINKPVQRTENSQKQVIPAIVESQKNFNKKSKIPVFDQAELLERLGNDSEMSKKFISMFNSSTGSLLIKLRKAMNSADFEQVCIKANTIKGISGNISARKMKETAASIEAKAKERNLDSIALMVKQLEDEFEEFRLESGKSVITSTHHN